MGRKTRYGRKSFGRTMNREVLEADLFYRDLLGQTDAVNSPGAYASRPSSVRHVHRFRSGPLEQADDLPSQQLSWREEQDDESGGLPGDDEEAWSEFDAEFVEPDPSPNGANAPFAPQLTGTGYWPIITNHAQGRTVSYRTSTGSWLGTQGRSFGANRSSGTRYHLGVDLFGRYGDSVVAIEDGRIVNVYAFCCGSNKTTWALLVQHANVVVNYGEVTPDSLSRNSLRVGDNVRAGQVIGRVGRNPGGSSMIHFETYTTGTTRNYRWLKGHARPARLLNPTRLLLQLQEQGLPRPAAGGATTTTAASTSFTSASTASGAATSVQSAPTQSSSTQSSSTQSSSTQSSPGQSSSPQSTSAPSTTDWTTVSADQRILHVMNLLVNTHHYPVNGAAGLVGNLWAESGVLPSRVEGSNSATPMRARDFSGQWVNFTAEQIMNRSRSARRGPRLPGVGLAQWTTASRRAGLFQHQYQGRQLGADVLFNMGAQVDYLVNELRSRYQSVNRVLTSPGVTVNAASDEVIYRFEVPGRIIQDRRRLPRSDSRVQEVFAARRRYSQRALSVYRNAHTSGEQEDINENDWYTEDDFGSAEATPSRRWSGCTGYTANDAHWAADNVSIDYRHLNVAGVSQAFNFTANHLEQLCRLNRFDVTAGQDQVLFGLRGCRIVGGASEGAFVNSVQLSEDMPDHFAFHCVMGVWKRSTRQIAVFTGSTVPNWGNMCRQTQVAAGKANPCEHLISSNRKANLLPTGRYLYNVGRHAGKTHIVESAFIMNKQLPVVVLRSFNNLTYETTDCWDRCSPADNIHPSFSSSYAEFSSAGCQTVSGSFTNGRHSGSWATFRERAGLDPNNNRDRFDDRFVYVLLTGREARLISTGHSTPLDRLRFGSQGPSVQALQMELKRRRLYTGAINGLMDPSTVMTYIKWQQARDHGAADGIVTPTIGRSLGFDMIRQQSVPPSQSTIREDEHEYA